MTGFARFLHYVSILLTLVIGLSWVMFAVDEVGDASDEQSRKIVDPESTAPAGTTPAPVVKEKRTFRSTVDDAAEWLTSPFDGIVAEDGNVWLRHTVPAILGVLLYGLGLAVLARWIVTRD